MRSPPPDCITAAQLADRHWGVFASVSLAQGVLESAWFTKGTGAFNFFGIKQPDLSKPGVICHTHEEIKGKLVAQDCRFASYPSVTDAFDAHARLIATEPVYAQAMVHKDDLATFVRLMAAHYATDSSYASKLLDLIHIEGFARFDAALARKG